MEMKPSSVIRELKRLADPEKVRIKQTRFGVTADNALGVYQKDLKDLAREIGHNNELAVALFNSGIYEARLLCSKIYDPGKLSEKQMNEWVVTFENWEICDSFSMGLFAKSEHAIPKAIEWSENDAEFTKRAGFAIMASYGFANKNAANAVFESFLRIVERESNDDRLYIKKAVNWALRSIGKRNIDLRKSAITVANRISKREQKSAQWIARDALNELEKPTVHVLDYPRAIYRKQVK